MQEMSNNICCASLSIKRAGNNAVWQIRNKASSPPIPNSLLGTVFATDNIELSHFRKVAALPFCLESKVTKMFLQQKIIVLLKYYNACFTVTIVLLQSINEFELQCTHTTLYLEHRSK